MSSWGAFLRHVCDAASCIFPTSASSPIGAVPPCCTSASNWAELAAPLKRWEKQSGSRENLGSHQAFSKNRVRRSSAKLDNNRSVASSKLFNGTGNVFRGLLIGANVYMQRFSPYPCDLRNGLYQMSELREGGRTRSDPISLPLGGNPPAGGLLKPHGMMRSLRDWNPPPWQCCRGQLSAGALYEELYSRDQVPSLRRRDVRPDSAMMHHDELLDD